MADLSDQAPEPRLLHCATGASSDAVRQCCADTLASRGKLLNLLGEPTEFPPEAATMVFQNLVKYGFQPLTLSATQQQVATALGTDDESVRQWVVEVGCGMIDPGESQPEILSGMMTLVEADSCNLSSAEETEQAILDLTSCLRDNGLDIEDPTVDASGNVDFGNFGDLSEVDDEVAEQALDACRDLLDGVTLGFADQIDFTAIEDGLLEYAVCMRDNGFDLPDPDFSLDAFFGGGPDGEQQGPFGDIDPDDPAFAAANEECEYILTQMFSGVLGGG